MTDRPQKLWAIYDSSGCPAWRSRNPGKPTYFDNVGPYYAESVPQALADALAEMLEFFHGYQNMEMKNWREALAAWEKIRDD